MRERETDERGGERERRRERREERERQMRGFDLVLLSRIGKGFKIIGERGERR